MKYWNVQIESTGLVAYHLKPEYFAEPVNWIVVHFEGECCVIRHAIASSPCVPIEALLEVIGARNATP